MAKPELKNWTLSQYNEGTKQQLDYYIDENNCKIGDKAYMYCHNDNKYIEMEIVDRVDRLTDMEYYDNLGENELIRIEDKCNADTSAEFITDKNCYLICFRYI